ncbi:MAG: EscU/YscU/HrcU family type III secretion system export apparatus switch protein [Myxococcales bacterium]|nr:EscU/YscU/HrcU family type III secretion system export apparatus switch protein [Myxococcales bacterium]
MSGGDSSDEKTEEATPHKLREARKKGQVAKSTDFTTGVVFAFSAAVLYAMGPSLIASLQDFVIRCFKIGTLGPSHAITLGLVMEGHKLIIVAVLPLFAIAFVAALAGNLTQFGFMFTTHPLQPELTKLNPVKGAQNLLNKKKFVQLLLSLAKFTVVCWLVSDALLVGLPNVLRSAPAGVESSLSVLVDIVVPVVAKVAVFLLAIGIIDRFWQIHVFKKDQRMSKHDVKQEYKQTEGDPLIKGQRRQLAEELLLHGSIEDVKNADVVIVNPDHIAVAIRYDEDEEAAPRVIAKGQRLIAEQIKEVAKQFGVPVMRNVPLAHALHDVDVGHEIPEDLYEAVAEVLNFIYELEATEKERHRRR